MVDLRKLSESEGEQFVIDVLKQHGKLTTLQIDDFARNKNVQCPDSTARFLAKLKLKKIINGEFSMEHKTWLWWLASSE